MLDSRAAAAAKAAFDNLASQQPPLSFPFRLLRGVERAISGVVCWWELYSSRAQEVHGVALYLQSWHQHVSVSLAVSRGNVVVAIKVLCVVCVRC